MKLLMLFGFEMGPTYFFFYLTYYLPLLFLVQVICLLLAAVFQFHKGKDISFFNATKEVLVLLFLVSMVASIIIMSLVLMLLTGWAFFPIVKFLIGILLPSTLYFIYRRKYETATYVSFVSGILIILFSLFLPRFPLTSFIDYPATVLVSRISSIENTKKQRKHRQPRKSTKMKKTALMTANFDEIVARLKMAPLSWIKFNKQEGREAPRPLIRP